MTAYGSVLANGAGNYAGGLAALSNGRVEHCYNHGAVAGGQNTGGLLGRHTGMLYGSGAFEFAGDRTDNVGGLIDPAPEKSWNLMRPEWLTAAKTSAVWLVSTNLTMPFPTPMLPAP